MSVSSELWAKKKLTFFSRFGNIHDGRRPTALRQAFLFNGAREYESVSRVFCFLPSFFYHFFFYVHIFFYLGLPFLCFILFWIVFSVMF